MSLLSEKMEPCVMLIAPAVSDSYGGYGRTWTDGAGFDAAVVFEASNQTRKGEADGVTSRYTIITSREKVLKFHDVFRRKSDGKIFRVTSDGDDSATPLSTSLDMRQCTAEEWRLPNG